MPKFHDPVPDGKSGSFNREPHRKFRTAVGQLILSFDPRCEKCREDKADLARIARAYDSGLWARLQAEGKSTLEILELLSRPGA